MLSLRYPKFRIDCLKILPQDNASICRLHTEFLLRISFCKDELLVRINEKAIVKSMYMESSLHEAIGRQDMIAFNIAQAKGLLLLYGFTKNEGGSVQNITLVWIHKK